MLGGGGVAASGGGGALAAAVGAAALPFAAIAAGGYLGKLAIDQYFEAEAAAQLAEGLASATTIVQIKGKNDKRTRESPDDVIDQAEDIQNAQAKKRRRGQGAEIENTGKAETDLKKALRDLARHPPGKDDDSCE